MSRDVSSIPRPLRKGDRVRADVAYRVVGTFESVNDSGRCWVREDNGDLHVVDTRIDDPPDTSSASPLASTTREDGASGDAALCDEGSMEGAGGSQDPGPTPDWTPTEGMLIERISDRKCFRLRYEADVDRWFLHCSDTALTYGVGRSEKAISSHYRPRCLKIGDVIGQVTGGLPDFLLADKCIGQPISGIRTFGRQMFVEVDTDEIIDGVWRLCDSRTIHIVGLGPVPWPPQTREKA